MTSYDVRNDKLTIYTRNYPRYQIFPLKNITKHYKTLQNITKHYKGGIVVVFRSIISNFIDILREMIKNVVNNDVIRRQKLEIDCFDIKLP